VRPGARCGVVQPLQQGQGACWRESGDFLPASSSRVKRGWQLRRQRHRLVTLQTWGPAPAASGVKTDLFAPHDAAGGAGEERDLSVVACGRPFYLEVQALDRFTNK
jgi:hypothetical protein